MFEYRVEIYAVREAEEKMNRLGADGWRVIAVTSNLAMGHGIIVTFERHNQPAPVIAETGTGFMI